MKKLTKIFSVIFILTLFSIVLINKNISVNAWHPEDNEDRKETGKYVSSLASFQTYWSSDIKLMMEAKGYSTCKNDMIYFNTNSFGAAGYYDFNYNTKNNSDEIAVGCHWTDNPEEAITSLYAESNDEGIWYPEIYRNVNGFQVKYQIVGGYYYDDDNEDYGGVVNPNFNSLVMTNIVAQDFNATAGGKWVFLYYAKDLRAGSPITRIWLCNENYDFKDYYGYEKYKQYLKAEYENYNITFVRDANKEVVSFNDDVGSTCPDIALYYEQDPFYYRHLQYSINDITYDGGKINNYLPDNFMDTSSIINGIFRFAGWYYDKACTIPANAGAAINSTYVQTKYNSDYKLDDRILTLYAKVTHEAYTINYATNGANEYLEPSTGVYKIPDTLPILTKDGCVFNGWFYDEEHTQRVVLGADIYHDVTLYAEFDEGQCISNIKLLFNNNNYKMTDIAIQKGMKVYSFNLGTNGEDCYKVYLGITYTADQTDAITNIIFIDGATYDAITAENKEYVYNGVTYTPVECLASNEQYDSLSINSTYNLDGSYKDETSYSRYYLYVTKDNNAGKAIDEFKFTNQEKEGFENTVVVGDNNTNLKNLKFSRYTNIYTGSVFSSATAWIIVAGIVVVSGGAAAAILFSKKKKGDK